MRRGRDRVTKPVKKAFANPPASRYTCQMDDAINKAAEELRKAAAKQKNALDAECGRLADQILNRPQPAKAETEDHAQLRKWHLTKISICRAAGVDPTDDVIHARRYGATWSLIGDACEITRQGAYEKWSKFAV